MSAALRFAAVDALGRCLLAGLAACCLTPAGARAQTAATIHPSFLPDRLGAGTTFALSIRFSGGEEAVPAPLSAMRVSLPAGLGVNLRGVPSCSPSRLRRLGPRGCPRAALLGRGHATLEVHAGSQTLPEQATLSLFRVPDRGGAPALQIAGHGDTPLDETVISSGVLQRASPPFGLRLAVSVPPIPTLVFEPNASFQSMSLALGAVGRARAHAAALITVPRHCPASGFPVAASFTFADASTATATAAIACP
jgi:hypothetical protein